MTTTLAAFIITLGVLILVHELGHFLMAKAAGVRVLTFSIGFGPPIVSFTRGETEYAVCWLPLGGYVKMAGEEPEGLEPGEPEPEWEEGDFMAASLPRRFGIITAGPVMNLFLAVLIYFGIALVVGNTIIPTTRVGTVQPGSVAEKAGFQHGDAIVAVDGESVDHWGEAFGAIQEGIGVEHAVTVERGGEQLDLVLPSFITGDGQPREGAEGFYGLRWPIGTRVASVVDTGAAAAAGMRAGDEIVAVGGREVDSWYELTRSIQDAEGGPVEVAWMRGGERMSARVRLQRSPPDSTGGREWMLGIASDPTDFEMEYRHPGLVGAAVQGVEQTWGNITMTVEIVERLMTGRISAKTLGGPVMIAQVAGDQARGGLGSLVVFMAFLSVQLGILNLLPIPVLDGGHLVFLGAEAVRGRPLPMRVRLIATQIGMALLLMLMIYVTFNDIIRVF
ncbi:MAG: RIP metalloprotease RseP [bacterium]